MTERTEAWMRIIVGIVAGIVLGIWKGLVQIVVIVHWFYVVLTGKRSKDLYDFCQIWNLQMYEYLKYMSFVQNKRPFPFGKLVR
jgi:hypothetical protein